MTPFTTGSLGKGVDKLTSSATTDDGASAVTILTTGSLYKDVDELTGSLITDAGVLAVSHW